MYDYLVVGSGLFGSVFAHELRKAGKTVLIFEKREHVGGNIYTKNEAGINVHVYGPHIFHTSSKPIWDYVNQFCKFNHFVNRPKANYKGKLYSLPINMNTFYQVAGCVTPADAKRYLDSQIQQCLDPKNFEQWAVSQIGRELFDILIHGYTKKQWKRDPKELPASIIRRLPIRLTYDDNYYNDPYQGIPIGGYTQIIDKLLDQVPVELGIDFETKKADWRRYAKKLVYCGKIDSFYDYCFGELEYLTLEFKSEHLQGDYQGNAIVNYTEETVPFTRIIEHKHFEFGQQENTIITREYPVVWSKDKVPYYPINNDKNNEIYQRYKKIDSDVIIGGRLGGFKYFDMDQTIAQALNLVKQELT